MKYIKIYIKLFKKYFFKTIELMSKSIDNQNSREDNLIDFNKKLIEIEVRKKIDKFEKYIDSFDDEPHYFVVLANLNLQINDLQRALHYLNVACSLFPKEESIYDIRSKVLYNLKDYNGALMNLNQAISINSKNELYYFRRGNVFSKLKIYSKAVEDYSSAIEINSFKYSYFFNRAVARNYLRDYENSILDFEKTLTLQPNKNVKEFIQNYTKRIALKNQNL